MPLPTQITALLLVAAALLPVVIGLIFAPNLTKELLRDLRFPRILHFVALAFLGVALQLKSAPGTPEGSDAAEGPLSSPITSTGSVHRSHLSSFHFHPLQNPGSDPFASLSAAFSTLVLSLTFAAIFAIVTNNLADLAADHISNPNRPTVRGTVAPKPYLIAGILCQIWALAIPWLLPTAQALPITLAVAGISLGYFVYSCPPLRLKRVPILAKVIIGANSWVVALGGFALSGGAIADFPVAWSIFILVPLALAANFIDLKDVEGDRAIGIATLPVLMGVQNARHLIAAATAATYIMGGLLLNLWWAWPLNLIALATHMYLLYRPHADERLIFLVHVGSLFGLGGMLLIA
ncbi:MAG: UbiA family prenyltransferase [Bacteroidia bacterium]